MMKLAAELNVRAGRVELTAEMVRDAIRVANRWPKNRGFFYFSIDLIHGLATKEERRKYG